jgi:hypothetical protein
VSHIQYELLTEIKDDYIGNSHYGKRHFTGHLPRMIDMRRTVKYDTCNAVWIKAYTRRGFLREACSLLFSCLEDRSDIFLRNVSELLVSSTTLQLITHFLPSAVKEFKLFFKLFSVQRLRLALSNGPSRAGVSDPLPGDGNRFTCRNVVFFRTPDDGQSPKHTVNPTRFSRIIKICCALVNTKDIRRKYFNS